jgi:hypothetical protein
MIADFDDLAYSDLVLCAGGNGVPVILLDVDIVGQHVHGPQCTIPRQPVCRRAGIGSTALTVRGSGFAEFWLSVVGTWIGIGGLLFVS